MKDKNIELNDELLAQATGGEDSAGDPTCDPRFSVGDLVLRKRKIIGRMA